MRGFWRSVKGLALAMGLACSLACAGVIEGLGELAGLDIEMQIGESATHPPDFPAAPIQGGTRSLFMAMTADSDNLDLPPEAALKLPEGVRYRMEMVVYNLPAGKIPEAQGTAESQVEAKGFERQPVEVEGNETVGLFEKDGTLFAVVGAAEQGASGDSAVLLIRLVPTPATPEG